MMSDMKTFTVRELDRTPAAVLEASKADGCARIRERGGQTYLITPEAASGKLVSSLPDFAGRRSKLSKAALPPSVARRLDRAIAGE